MALTKETAVRIYNCYQQIEACDKFKKDVTELIERQKAQDEKRSEPISVNSFTRFGRGCQMGIVESGSTASMRIFDISHELALLVIDEHRKKLEKDLDELQKIAVREQAADFSRNARLFNLLEQPKFQWEIKLDSFYNYSEFNLICKLAEQIGYNMMWANSIYYRIEALQDDAIDRIVKTCDFVNREWLADGVGEMFIKNEDKKI